MFKKGTLGRFTAVIGDDTMLQAGVTTSIKTRHQCITAMFQYSSKSLEELRYEDYTVNNKGPRLSIYYKGGSATGKMIKRKRKVRSLKSRQLESDIVFPKWAACWQEYSNFDQPAADTNTYPLVAVKAGLALQSSSPEDVIAEGLSKLHTRIEWEKERDPDMICQKSIESSEGQVGRGHRCWCGGKKYAANQYSLLDELTPDQKQCCPKEKLFGTLVCHLTRLHILGINLGFTWSQVERFTHNHPGCLATQTLEMLVSWKKKHSHKATVERLVKAFQTSNIPELCYRKQVLDYFSNSDQETDDDFQHNAVCKTTPHRPSNRKHSV